MAVSEDRIKSIPYKKYVNLESPYEKDKRVVYHAWVNVKDLPDGIPTEVNPREVREKTNVYKKIVTGLETSDDSFFVNNRGILISAKEVRIDTFRNHD